MDLAENFTKVKKIPDLTNWKLKYTPQIKKKMEFFYGYRLSESREKMK